MYSFDISEHICGYIAVQFWQFFFNVLTSNCMEYFGIFKKSQIYAVKGIYLCFICFAGVILQCNKHLVNFSHGI